MEENPTKAVILDFDFAAEGGAKLLFETTAAFLENLDGIPFDRRIEAEYLAGVDCEEGLKRYFAVVKTKKTPQKAARDIVSAYAKALAAAIPSMLTPAFRNFVKVLVDRGVKVVIVTRADVEKTAPAFEGIVGENVALCHEPTMRYGGVRSESWRRAAYENRLRPGSTVVVAGTGFGIKGALMAGMASLAVVSEHTAYQDFVGADDSVAKLDSSAAKKAIEILRI